MADNEAIYKQPVHSGLEDTILLEFHFLVLTKGKYYFYFLQFLKNIGQHELVTASATLGVLKALNHCDIFD